MLVPVAAMALLLTACGGGPDDGGSAAAATPAPTASGSRGAGPGGGQDQGGGPRGAIDFDKVQQCLDAAGLDITLPSFDPNTRPSGPRPSFDPDSTERPRPPADDDEWTPPSGAPDGGPGGERGPGGGAFRELFTNPEVQAALEACGIELPQRPEGARPSPTS